MLGCLVNSRIDQLPRVSQDALLGSWRVTFTRADGDVIGDASEQPDKTGRYSRSISALTTSNYTHALTPALMGEKLCRTSTKNGHIQRRIVADYVRATYSLNAEINRSD